MMAPQKINTFLLFCKLSVAIFGLCGVAQIDAFMTNPGHSLSGLSSVTRLFSSATNVGTAPMLKSLLKKPSKVLTVGVEYSPQQESESDDEGSLEVLSMKLRQQSKVSFIVCNDISAIQQFSKEQESAKGNFPGPIPIICDSGESSVQEFSEAGASAIVVDTGSTEALSLAESASSAGLETIWKVSTAEEAKQVLESTNELADAFLLDVQEDFNEAIPQIMEVLPKSSMAIATIYDPMQEDGAEIETGKEFKSMGCASVFVKKAIVGDKEDIEYSSFLVGGLTSKASKEFKFSGLTGSTNGHFGGIQANGSVKWERTRVYDDKKDDE